MNKEELEAMFDEKFLYICENMPIKSDYGELYELKDIKEFIFDTIIPEVLKEIIPEIQYDNPCDEERYMNDEIIKIKQKAKEQFNKMLQTLQIISKSDTIKYLRKNNYNIYGLEDYTECLEMSYENLQEVAKYNIKGIKKIII